MNAESLKNSILQLAIQGKLVEQREEDGTAEELYKEIQLEKEKLIEEGKIRKQKKLPKITEEEIPFEIPDNWRWVRLNDLVKSIRAGGDKPKEFSKEITSKHTIPVIGNGKTNDGIVGYTDKATVEDSAITISGRGTIGYSSIRDYPFCPIVRLIVLDISDNINFKFLQKAILNLLEVGVGTSIKQLTVPMVRPKVIPLPPLAEQKRIVEKIEELMPHVERYGKAYEEVTELNKNFPVEMEKSILQYAIQGKLVEQREEEGIAEELYKQIQLEKEKLIEEGKIRKRKKLPKITEEEIPFEIPESWKWVRLSDLTENIHYGYTASAQDNGNAKLLRITDIQDNKVEWMSVPHCDISEENFSKYSLNNRDILIARTGGTIGKTYIVNSLHEKSVFASYLIRAIPLKGINKVFLKKIMERDLYCK